MFCNLKWSELQSSSLLCRSDLNYYDMQYNRKRSDVVPFHFENTVTQTYFSYIWEFMSETTDRVFSKLFLAISILIQPYSGKKKLF